MRELYEMKVGTVRTVDFELTPKADPAGNQATHERRTVIRVPGGWYVCGQFTLGGTGVFIPLTIPDRLRIAFYQLKELTKKAKAKWDGRKSKQKSK